MSSVESGYAEVNGTRLYYEHAGEGNPVVLIHGNFGDCRHWDDQFSALAESCTVLRYDCRGFGKSSMPVEGKPYSHHDDLKALMSHLTMQEAHICGVQRARKSEGQIQEDIVAQMEGGVEDTPRLSYSLP